LPSVIETRIKREGQISGENNAANKEG